MGTKVPNGSGSPAAHILSVLFTTAFVLTMAASPCPLLLGISRAATAPAGSVPGFELGPGPEFWGSGSSDASLAGETGWTGSRSAALVIWIDVGMIIGKMSWRKGSIDDILELPNGSLRKSGFSLSASRVRSEGGLRSGDVLTAVIDWSSLNQSNMRLLELTKQKRCQGPFCSRQRQFTIAGAGTGWVRFWS